MYKNVILNATVKKQFNDIRKKHKNIINFELNKYCSALTINDNGIHTIRMIYDKDITLYLDGVKIFKCCSIFEFEQICFDVMRNEELIPELDSVESLKLTEENLKLYTAIGGFDTMLFSSYFSILFKYSEICLQNI